MLFKLRFSSCFFSKYCSQKRQVVKLLTYYFATLRLCEIEFYPNLIALLSSAVESYNCFDCARIGNKILSKFNIKAYDVGNHVGGSGIMSISQF